MKCFHIFYFQFINLFGLWIIHFLIFINILFTDFSLYSSDFFLQIFRSIIELITLLIQLFIDFILILIITDELFYIINISLYLEFLKYHFISVYFHLNLLIITCHFLCNPSTHSIAHFTILFLSRLIIHILISIYSFQYFATII